MFSSFSELSKKGYTCPDLLSACCMYDCSLLKCQRCIKKYCCCCCPIDGSSERKYPHISYGRIQSQDDEKLENVDRVKSTSPRKIFHRQKTIKEEITSVPYEKIFQFPQPQQYSIHPQVSRSFQSTSGVPSVVSQQPRLKEYRSDSSESRKSQEVINNMPLSDYSPYDSMDDIDAEVGFVDMAKSSVYAESDGNGSLRVPQYGSPARRARSPSPLRSSIRVPSVSEVETKLRRRSLRRVSASPEASFVHFSLYYDEDNHKLIVHLKQAFRLPTSRPEESCNPFAEVYLLPKKKTVHVSQSLVKTHKPMFDETFTFTDLDPQVVRQQVVLMRLYINERSHFIGGVLYPLESASMNGDLIKVGISEFDEKESLKGCSCGDILLSLCYHSKAKSLEVVIIEINNLRKSDFIGLSNPYVKVNLMQPGRRLIKWKTSVKKNTLMPIFYESARFDVTRLDLDDIYFDILIMDHDRVGRNSILGVVKLGHKVSHTSGEYQWRCALNNPDQLCNTWHCIRPVQKGTSSPSLRRSKSPSCINVGTQI